LGAVNSIVHVVDQAADIFAGQIAFQRPGRIGVAERRREIGHVGIHHALVVQRLGEFDRAAVDADLHAAEHLQNEPGGGDDDVGLNSLPSFSLMPLLVKLSISLVTTEARFFLDRPEQVAIGHQAEPLIPGIVARREMRSDVVVRAERHPHAAEDQLLDPIRLAPGELEEIHPPQHVAPADQKIGEF
jgi:hypothetical protein